MTSYPTNVSNSQWQIISNSLDIERNRRYELQEKLYHLLKLLRNAYLEVKSVIRQQSINWNIML